MRSHTIIAALLLTLSSPAMAEYRVALLIRNNGSAAQPNAASSLDQVQHAFEQHGFRCQVTENLASEKQIREVIEGFSASTPALSTAAIYFQGALTEGPSLLATDRRSKYALDKLMTTMETRGGSRSNLLFLEVPDRVAIREIPDSFRIVQGSAAELRKEITSGSNLNESFSTAISSPDQFISGNQAGDQWVNHRGVVFCWCPPGKYVAGSPDSEPGRYVDEAQRTVTIDHGFWLSKYELALGQPIANRRAGNQTIARHKLHPMTMINHDDAKSMTRNLTDQERKAGRLADDWQYTLPTEEQWEYAARAGTSSRFYFGDELSLLPLHANFADKTHYENGDVFSNAANRNLNDGVDKLAKIGSYRPNPWGFHDMYGNVAEWCINQAVRGGSWATVPENCRSAYRDSFSSRNEQNFIGYRLVIQKIPPADKPITNR